MRSFIQSPKALKTFGFGLIAISFMAGCASNESGPGVDVYYDVPPPPTVSLVAPTGNTTVNSARALVTVDVEKGVSGLPITGVDVRVNGRPARGPRTLEYGEWPHVPGPNTVVNEVRLVDGENVITATARNERNQSEPVRATLFLDPKKRESMWFNEEARFRAYPLYVGMPYKEIEFHLGEPEVSVKTETGRTAYFDYDAGYNDFDYIRVDFDKADQVSSWVDRRSLRAVSR